MKSIMKSIRTGRVDDNNPSDPVKVVVTGGHHTPALAVMEELKKRGNFEFHWIGHRVSLGGEHVVSAEFRTIERLKIPFYSLRTGKFYRTSIYEWLKIPLGFFHALYLLAKIRPRLVISFGGYLAAPVVLAASLLRIPSVTHEQTVISGWANHFIATFAKKIFVSWPQSLSNFPKGKTLLTGNPLRKAIFEKKTDRFQFREKLPVIYVTGGKQGAHLINEAIRGALSKFLKKYNLIHQTGSAEAFKDYQRVIILRDQLPQLLRRRYIIQEYFGEEEIGAVYASADVVVGRSGANTVSELAALGKPAILIPISRASHREQLLNAQLLAKSGAALILKEEQLSPTSLLGAIDTVAADLSLYRRQASLTKKLVNLRAASRIANEVVSILE